MHKFNSLYFSITKYIFKIIKIKQWQLLCYFYYNYYFTLGLGHEHFWTSGTDQAEEGSFFWLANGRPIGFTNWNAGEPNNFKYENGEEEHCLELWNRDGKGLKWNDSPCSFETFFVCEMWTRKNWLRNNSNNTIKSRALLLFRPIL